MAESKFGGVPVAKSKFGGISSQDASIRPPYTMAEKVKGFGKQLMQQGTTPLLTGVGGALALKALDIAAPEIGLPAEAAASILGMAGGLQAGKTAEVGMGVRPAPATTGEALADVGKSFEEALAYELFPRTIMAGGKALLTTPIPFAKKSIADIAMRPFKESIVPASQSAFAKLGIKPGLASDVTKSNLAIASEKSAAGSMSGRAIEDAGAKTEQDIIAASNKAIEQTNGITNLSIGGAKVRQGFQKMIDAFHNGTEKLFNKVPMDIPAAATETKTRLINLSNRAKQTMESARSPSENAAIEMYDNMVDEILNLEGKYKNQTLGSLKATRTSIGKRLKNFNDPITVGHQAELRSIYEALTQDMMDAAAAKKPELKPALQRAIKFAREGFDKLNTEYGRIVMANESTPSEIIPTIFDKSTPVEDIKTAMQLIGKPAQKDVRAGVMQMMFDKARTSQTGPFSERGLANILKQFQSGGDRLSAIFTPEQVATLNNLATVAEAHGKATRMTKANVPAWVGRVFIEMASGKFLASPITAGAVMLGDAGFSKFISTDAGKKWLTTGFENTSEASQKFIEALTKSGMIAGGTLLDQTMAQRPKTETKAENQPVRPRRTTELMGAR